MTYQNTGFSQSVVTMRAFDPSIVESIFTRVDLAWPKSARAQFNVTSLGDLSLIRSHHTACRSTSRRLERHMTDRDASDHFAVLPLSGAVEVRRLGQMRSNASAGAVSNRHLALVNTAEEYEIEMSEDLDAIWLRIPSKLLRSHAIAVDELVGRPLDIQRGLGFMAKQMMESATVQASDLTDRCARVFSHSLLSFLGEVISSNLQGTTGGSGTRGRRMILRRAQDYIEAHIHDEDLTPAGIAKGIGISARYLSDVFAAEGTSPMRWVRQRRLELCRIELERNGNGQQLICEVAYSMGFTNVSSFNRAFKAQFGLSPRELMAQNAKSVSQIS